MAIEQVHTHHHHPPKHECSIQETIDNLSYFRIENCFNELTPEQKELARKNLGVEQLTANSVSWGNIIGDIKLQEDLIDLIKANQIDLSNYADKDYVDTSRRDLDLTLRYDLNKYWATKAYVDQRVVDIASGGTITLDGYPTRMEVTEEIQQSASELSDKIDKINSDLDTIYATDEELENVKVEVESKIPTKVGQLENDAKYITSSVSDLLNYPTKAEMTQAILEAQLDLDDFNPEDLALIKNSATKQDLELVENKLTTHIEESDERIQALEQKEIPTKVSQLENDEKYIKSSELGETIDEKLENFSIAAGNGIPVLDSRMIEELGEDLPTKYISIPSEVDLRGEVTNNTYTTTKNSNYVDVLFSAIRALQSEVARLRNSFKYGINSYSGTNTAMSSVLDDYSTNVDDEPLWAVEEEDLSQITYLTLGNGCELIPAGNVDVSVSGQVTVNGTATWLPDDNTNDVKDPKLLLYLTTTGQGITLNLKAEDETLSVDLSKLGLNDCDIYNYLIILSRKIENKGSNFLWISATNYKTDHELAEGYWKNDHLQTLRYELPEAYSYESIDFTDLTLSKFDLYSKYQDFSKEVIPSKPDDSDYKYEAAHITIRSCQTLEIATSIVDQLLENELVFISGPKLLYIKSNGKLVAVGSSKGASDEPIIDNGMTEQEILNLLQEGGYVTKDANGDIKVKSISELDFVTFVNKDTQKEYKFTCDAYGNLTSQEVNEAKSIGGMLEDVFNRVGETTDKPTKFDYLGTSVRGTIGQLGLYQYTLAGGGTVSNAHSNIAKDLRLYSDRLKIGAWYAPYKSDKIFGCSHAYIELENTSDRDINLKGIRLYYKYHTGWDVPETGTATENFGLEYLDLTGTIPAGSTYLIRGKQYANYDDANCYIKVETYDQEWYDSNGELIDLSFDNVEESHGKNVYGFALIYQEYYDYLQSKDEDMEDFGPNTPLCTKITVGATNSTLTTPTGNYTVATGLEYSRPGYYIDSRVWNTTATIKDSWIQTSFLFNKNNSIIKNTFMLDPAKQAYQAHTTKESSRYRDVSNATDIIALQLNSSEIKFPNSSETRAVVNYTPKASFEKKNVSTDKTKLSRIAPNMVTCSFGRNPYNTRTFNWISCGLFDEYVWINIDGTWKKFSSYTTGDSTPESTDTYPYRIGFNAEITNAAYARITRRFPGDGTLFTSHKCIIKVIEDSVETPTVYKYKVARDLNGQPDPNYCSEEMQFTLYPKTYSPRIYQTSDQQGFHWVEYQVWNGAANLIEKKIDSDLERVKTIIPVLINTGDMTQNGTRINEWLDYYNAGYNLFKKYEQVNIVGNNDLCDTNPDILGTGDDTGKSNSYFFHLFYCYEIDPDNAPIINGVYLPSFYKLDFDYASIIMFNSEVTVENCRNWFNIKSDNLDGNGKPYVINAYTGYEIRGGGEYKADFKTVYEMTYQMLQESVDKEKVILVCHEMPYTVITNANIKVGAQATARRSLNGTSLIGCHCNQIDSTDSKGLHWLSRLCEYFNRITGTDGKPGNMRLFLGGHKHTYSCTYPVREFFYFLDEDEEGNKVVKNSREHFDDYVMPASLRDDNCYWTIDEAYTAAYGVDSNGAVNNLPSEFKLTNYDLTKFPLTRRVPATANYPVYPDMKTVVNEETQEESQVPNYYPYISEVESAAGVFYPYTPIPDLKYGIVYLMDQATGYKLTSNKELPSANQKFSYLIPMTTIDNKGADTASKYQKRPIMIQVRLDKGEDYEIEIMAIHNVMNDSGKFDQYTFASKAPFFGWYNPQGDWVHYNTGADANPWFPRPESSAHTDNTTASPLNEDHITFTIPLNSEANFVH